VKLACMFLLLLVAPSLAAVRLALVATVTEKTDQQAIDLATAELSSDQDIQLLDRESINSVLAEQKLSLSGLVDDDRVIQVGKLLKADLFAIVENDAKETGGYSLVVFDTTSGLRLMDSAITGPHDQVGQAVAAAIRNALAKDRKITKGLHLVGFPVVRNVDLPRDQDVVCDTVAVLLERELTASPGIAVLERSHLGEVNQERELPTTKAALGNLRPSLTIVQLEISKGKNRQGLQATADLIGLETRSKITASVNTDSAADLAAKLGERLIDALKAEPIEHPFRRLDEARMFARDSQVLLKTGRIAAGLSAAEAAYALIPGEHDRSFLAEALWARASQYLTPDTENFAALNNMNGNFDSDDVSSADLDTAIGFAARAMTLEHDALKAKLAVPHGRQDFITYTDGEEQILLPGGFFQRLNAVPDIPDAYKSRIADLHAAARDFLRDYWNAFADSIPEAPQSLGDYDNEINNNFSFAGVISTSFAEFISMRDQMFHRWIGTFNQWWPKCGNLWWGSGDFQIVAMNAILTMEDMSTHRWTDFNQEAFAKSFAPVIDDLQKSTCPVMQIYGVVAETLAHRQTAAATPAQRDQAIQALIDQLQTAVQKSQTHPWRLRHYAYYAAAHGIILLPAGTHARDEELIRLFEVAEQRRQLLPQNVLEFISENIDLDSSDDAPRRWLAALEKMQQLSQEANYRFIDQDLDSGRQALAGEIHDLRQKYPRLGVEKVARVWDSSIKLADVASLSQISALEYGVQTIDNRACFIGSGTDTQGQFFIQAFEVPLSGGLPKALAKIIVKPLSSISEDGSGYGDNFTYRLIEASAVDDQNFYVSVRGQGVVVFPRDGSLAIRVDTHDGLPSDWTQALAAADGKLFITSTTVNGAYLLAWKRADHSVKLLISSLGKDHRSPLEDVPGLRLRWIANDAPRHRLLLGVDQDSPDIGTHWNIPWQFQKGGLWQLDLSKGKLKQLLTVDSALDLGHFRGIDGDSLFISMPMWVVRYDLATSRGEYASYKPGSMAPTYIRQIHLQSSTPRGTIWADPDWETAGNRVVIHNWLWVGEPFSRISADGKTVQLLDPKISSTADPADHITTIMPVSQNQILIGDRKEMFVLMMTTADTLIRSAVIRTTSGM
jgi:hypothetical protein